MSWTKFESPGCWKAAHSLSPVVGTTLFFRLKGNAAFTSRRQLPKQLLVGLALWVHRLRLLIASGNADGSPARQKVQEAAQTFPTPPRFGNPHQRRCWSSRLPSRAGHWSRRSVESFYHDSGDGPDPIVTLDENKPRASQIVFNDKKSEGQALPVPGTSTPAVLVDDIEHGNAPASECFCLLLLCPILTLVCVLLPIRRQHR